MTDDAAFLARADLDGELDADERARVRERPDVSAEIERQRMVAALVADLDPPSIATREAQLATALGAWDRLPETERTGVRRDATPAGADPAIAAAAGSVTHLRRPRRRPSAVVVSAAAALIGVIVGAGVVLTRVDDRDAGLTSEAVVADTAAATERTGDAGDTESEVASNAAPAADEAVGDGDGAADSDILVAEDLATEADELENADANASASAEPDDQGPPPDDSNALVVLRNADDLADFAAPAKVAPESGTVDSTSFPPCTQLGIDVVVGPATYEGVGPVLVGVDRDRDRAVAYLGDSCSTVQTAPLP